MPSATTSPWLQTVMISSTLLPDFPELSTLWMWGPSVASSGRVMVNGSMLLVLCPCWITSRGRQTEGRTGTTTWLNVGVGACAWVERCCETESVWGHAEWETSILFGHTADSHSPTLTFWNGLLDSYHIAQASLPNHSFFLHHFAIS